MKATLFIINTLTDYIANLALENKGKLIYNSFSDLPSQASMIINVDKQQVDTLRILTKSIQHNNEKSMFLIV